MKVKILFLGCIFFCCSTGILYSNPSDSNGNNLIIPMKEKCDKYEFIFRLKINNKSKISWNRTFSPKEYVEKAEKFIKENIGHYAKNWQVCEFKIAILDSYFYHYVVSFRMNPENGMIEGKPGVFNVYIEASGEIDFVKQLAN